MERPVVVCTQYRGVFFGYETKRDGSTITLNRARMCVRWTRSIRGVLGLASHGPDDSCRIGYAVESIELLGVTAIVDVSPEAVAKWEAAPWQK